MAEFVAGVGVNSVTEIGKCSIKSITRHVSYVFHFKKNVEDLMIAKRELKLKYETVKAEVERAALNIEVVNKNVEAWLNNVKEVVEALETLENEIQANMGCCNGWCPDWIWQYKQSKEATKKKIIVKQLKDTGSFNQVVHRVPTPGLEIFSSSDFEAFESRKSAFEQIMEALRDDNCSRIGVWGMGGVGKTTLVKEVSKIAKELKLFNDVAMAVVSRPLDVIQIQNEIADYLNLKFEMSSTPGRAREICLRIKNVEKILIILDDIWEEINFEDIGIPSRHDHKGCKILITTRSEHVCNVMSCEKKVQLKMMTEVESLTLFKKSACIEDDSLAINDDVVRQVVKECQGLPIAIVVVGKALIKKSLNDWNVALQQLRDSKLVDIEGVDVNKNAYVCLKWSYDHLKQNTKLCFLLCSLFPEDHKIPIEDLIRYAIGLEVYDDVKSIEEGRGLVCSSINNLKESSLLLDASLGLEERVKMHDMVRDVALWIASKGENEFSLRTCTRLENIKNIENITAISLWANNANQLPANLVCPKLNILSLGEIPTYNEVKDDEYSKISDTLFEGMKGLRVLSLRNKFLSSQSLQILTNLRCLCLVNCNFDDLSSLGKLKSLEILSFRHCQMVALPDELRELSNLKVLDLLHCRQLERIPSNLMQALSQLEELNLMSLSMAVLSLMFSVNYLPNVFVFPKLQRYEIFSDEFAHFFFPITDDPTSRVLSIMNVDASTLNAFKVLFCSVETLILFQCAMECITDATGGNMTTAFSNLVILKLISMHSLTTMLEGPIQHTTFRNLTVLELNDCRRLTNLFSPSLVQNLEKLENLKLKRCHELQQIISEEEMLFTCHHIQPSCFPKLRILKVIDCRKLEYLFSMTVARGFLLLLEEMIIEDLPELKQVFGDEREGEVGSNEDKFELSELRELSLENLPKLTSFCQSNISLTRPSLERLLAWNCPKLKSSFVANLLPNVRAVEKTYAISVGGYFPRDYSKSRVLRFVDANASLMNTFKVLFCTVEKLDLAKCEVECFSDTIGGNNTVKFSNLVKLILNDMPSLRTLWEGPLQKTTFRNLTVLELHDCRRLTNLLSLSLVQNLEKLEALILDNCPELKQIISEEEMLFKDHHIQPSFFPKLKILKVIDCSNLEYLFSISVARGFLLQLEKMIIEDLPELKQVFGDEREGKVGSNEDKFELFELRELSLQNLPKLTSFCQSNISLMRPSLERLSVLSCPKMTPSFGANIVANVPAVGKVEVEGV